jgi:hypothetical protein
MCCWLPDHDPWRANIVRKICPDVNPHIVIPYAVLVRQGVRMRPNPSRLGKLSNIQDIAAPTRTPARDAVQFRSVALD